MTTLSAVAASISGTLSGEDRPFQGVSTDTRTIQRGELFVALKGPNFDGGRYLSMAQEKGAAGAIVSTPVDDSLAQITVADTREALGRLGAAWRREQSAVVVGITGSNGKTTLKELVAACLSETAPTLATAGNLNNEIGVPLMLTRIEPEHRFAVIEMGANHIGDIGYLTDLVEPDVVAITNAGAAHLEGFGSIDGVARGKGEILCGDARPGVAVLNADDPYFEFWTGLAKDAEIMSFGIESKADVYATSIVTRPDGSSFELHIPRHDAIEIELPLPGLHNVRNACAAAAIATSVGVSAEQIRAALEAAKPVAGRLKPIPGINGAAFYDDSYNANPYSVTAAAEFLAGLPGEGWLVLGDMGELGDDAAAMHRDVGAAARAAGVKRLFATGELSQNAVEAFGDGARWFDSVEPLIATLRMRVGKETNVLVKGSRYMRMERVIDALTGSGAKDA
ncbi:MAG: UDP-N-acetylmuramoyl-tripeptide--D-alanyl-D-alanine ligase [Pseudomonadota bacterium]